MSENAKVEMKMYFLVSKGCFFHHGGTDYKIITEKICVNLCNRSGEPSVPLW